MTRTTIAVTALALVLLAVLFSRFVAVGDGEARMVAGLVQTYADRTNDERDLLGDVGHVSCRKFARYRGEDVFLCEVEYSVNATGMWCAVVVDEKLLTQDREDALPCLLRKSVSPTAPS